MSPLVADFADKTIIGHDGREAGASPKPLPRDDVDRMRLKGKRIAFDIRESILGDPQVEQTIDGASTIVIKFHDPKRRLKKAGLLERGTKLTIDDYDFALVGAVKAGSTFTITFEPWVVWLLRQQKGFRRGFRDKMTRAEFALHLVREVRRPPIPFVCPELHKKQPIETEKQRKTEKKRRDEAGRGIDRGANLTVKGVKATAYQIRNAERALDVADARTAPVDAQVALILARINEALLRNPPYGHSSSVGGLQLLDIHADKVDRMDQEAVADLFLIEGFTGFGGGAIAMAKTGNYNVEQIASYTNYGAPPNFHDYPADMVAEARAFVAAYNGQSGSSSGRSFEINKRYRFTRLANESTWACLARLVEPVNWRRFEANGKVYFAAENDLINAKPRMRVREKTPGILNGLDYDYQSGRKTQEVTFACRLAKWKAPPGTVVAVEGEGEEVDGRYLVTKIAGGLFSADRSITLERAEREKEEPAPETRTISPGGSGGSNVDGTITTAGGAKGIVDQAAAIAADISSQNYVGSDHRPGDTVASGQPSDHSGNDASLAARDIGHRGIDLLVGPPHRSLDLAVVAIGKAFGKDYGDGRQTIIDTFNWRGYRVQIIWRTPLYGGHMGHIHIGARKL